MRLLPFRTFLCLILALLPILTGCREDLVLAPTVEYPFAMYGVLTPDLERQSVLVFPVEARPRLRTPQPLDATVTSTDLTTGETRTWQDSLTVDSLGFIEHVFWSDFRARHGHRYRIEVIRSDGAMSHAEVVVPDPVVVELDSSTSHRQVLHIRGDAVRMVKADITYTVQFYNPIFIPDVQPPLKSYTFSYWAVRTAEEGGWSIEIPMLYDYLKMKSWYALDTGYRYPDYYDDIAWIGMSLDAVVGDSAWNTPDGGFDPNIIGQPEIMDNVENGFGFVGGGYGIRGRNLYPLPEALENTGFYYVYELTR